jgi:hypothetical protein
MIEEFAEGIHPRQAWAPGTRPHTQQAVSV